MPKIYEIKFGTPIETMGPYESDIDLNKREKYDKNKKKLEEIIEKAGGNIAVEVKEDGYRCQTHVHHSGKRARIQLFSRGLKEFEESCFPEIVDSLFWLSHSLNLNETIFDGELKGLEKGITGFNGVVSRAVGRFVGMSEERIRDYLNSGIIEQNPLEFVLFDVLMYKGKECINLPYSERRKLVEEIINAVNTGNASKWNKFIRKSEQCVLETSDEIMNFYDQKVNEENAEGLVLKQPNLLYIPKDKKNWIKLKKFENLDLVVIGLYDKKSDKFGINYRKALLACYNPETKKYESVGTANLVKQNEFTGNKFGKDIEDLISQGLTSNLPNNVILGSNRAKNPDVYVFPEKSVVVEVSFMNINSCKNDNFGCRYKEKHYSLRTAEFEKLRTDKSPEQASITEQIARKYAMRS